MQVMFGDAAATIMAGAIMISTFGCSNGLILAGARVYYAMARDGLFFRATVRLNSRHVPSMALLLQGLWTCLLVLPRTRLRDPVTNAPVLDASGMEQYGNLYGMLLDYVVFAVLIFYVLTIGALFVLRQTRPNAERPYRAFGYPVLPALYLLADSVILVVRRSIAPKPRGRGYRVFRCASICSGGGQRQHGGSGRLRFPATYAPIND
jgi:APA family basic amino acid/polyamine antiporter